MLKYGEESESMGRRMRDRDAATLVDYLRGHQSFKSLTNEKIEIFKRYIEENPKGKFLKQTKYIGRSFIDKCPEHILEELVTKIYTEFREYLVSQKKTDDEKLRRIGDLMKTTEDRDSVWRRGFDAFCGGQERERSRDYRRR